MTFPAFLLGCVIAGVFGAGFHLVRGGGAGRLIGFLLAAGFGFWFGHLTANITGLTFFSLGPLRLGIALPVTLATLFGIDWLSGMDGQSRGGQ
jgi:hypothetical protein